MPRKMEVDPTSLRVGMERSCGAIVILPLGYI